MLGCLLASLSLAGCSSAKSYQIGDYRKTMAFHEGFKVLQLTDLHYSVTTILPDADAFVKQEIEDANADLIVITGDTFMDASTSIVQHVINYLDSFNVPFALTYGNHDFQGDYSSDYIGSLLEKTTNAVYVDYADDDIYGKTNYFIDLVKDNSVAYRLYIVDSNSYWYNGFGVKMGYDIIHEDQLVQMEKAKETFGAAPALAFYHIPVYEFSTAYTQYQNGEIPGVGENHEKCSVGYQESDAFARMKAVGVEGMFIGHDHINTTTLLYQDVYLSYGMKGTKEIYHESIGYTLLTLNTSGFGFDNIQKVVIA